MEIIRARANTVIGQLVEVGRRSVVLYTPNDDEKQTVLLRVTHVGPYLNEPEIYIGDTVVLDPEWSGAVLTLFDDQNRPTKYHLVHEDDLMATISNA